MVNSSQETKARTLTEDIKKIVKSMESSTELLRKEIAEADRQAELRRQEWEAQHARWIIEEDQWEIARSIKESREQLDQVIKSWATAIGIEQFLKGVQERASKLSEEQRNAVLERLQLARDFIGTHDPLDFFRTWKTPSERYLPLAMRKPKASPQPPKD